MSGENYWNMNKQQGEGDCCRNDMVAATEEMDSSFAFNPSNSDGNVDPGMTLRPIYPGGNVDPGMTLRPIYPGGEIDPGMTLRPPFPGGEIDPGMTLRPPFPGGEIDPGMTLRPPYPGGNIGGTIVVKPSRPGGSGTINRPINTAPAVLRSCMNGLVYVWLKNGEEFWMIPTASDNRRFQGYRWSQYGGWRNYSANLSELASVTCVFSV